jgi:HD-GYP domain-containing protein (c-di-GMP phosphodiesterase class II)
MAVPFGRSDILALTPFAALFGLHAGASRRYHDLKELLVGMTRSLTSAIDAKDAYTFGHSERVGRIAVELGRELNLTEDEVSDLYLVGLMHDIGKIGIRDAVLCKREPLTAEEVEHLKQHVTIGHAIVADLHPIRHLLPGILYHHERHDGAGYPEGLKGEAIPLIARILAVADAYDAMTTTRPYRNAMTHERAGEILKEGAGTQWDRQIVEAFFRCREKVFVIRQRGVGDSLHQAINGALRGQGSYRHPESISLVESTS